jgi:hypothetical protein
MSDLFLNCREQWDAGHDLHLDTLDEYFVDCLTQDFNMDFEDDRVVTEASAVVQELYRKCAAGELDEARKVLAAASLSPGLNGVTGGGAGSSDDEDGEDGGDGAGASEPRLPRREKVVDEDGWETVVVHRRGPAKGSSGSSSNAGAGAGAAGAGGGSGGVASAAKGVARMGLGGVRRHEEEEEEEEGDDDDGESADDDDEEEEEEEDGKK